MPSRILFSLKGAKIFSRNRLEAHNELNKNIINSMLYFDEVYFEGGFHSVSYGDTGTFQIKGRYNGLDEYKKLKSSYISDTDEKKSFVLTARAHGSTQEIPLINTPAFSFFASFEGELNAMCENFSPKELDFIKMTYPDPVKFAPIIKKNEDYIRSQMSMQEYPSFINPVMEKWKFPRMACGIGFRETLEAVTLSQGFDGKLLLDPFHNDILNFALKYFSNQLEQDKTPLVLTKIIPLMVPDYSSLNIERIIELRKEPSILEFRKTITNISDEIKGVSDIDSYIFSLWTQELLDDIERLAPKSRSKYVINSIIDLGVSVPVTPVPEIALLQLIAGLAKMVYEKSKEYEEIVDHNKSLSHFCSELRTI